MVQQLRAAGSDSWILLWPRHRMAFNSRDKGSKFALDEEVASIHVIGWCLTQETRAQNALDEVASPQRHRMAFNSGNEGSP